MKNKNKVHLLVNGGLGLVALIAALYMANLMKLPVRGDHPTMQGGAGSALFGAFFLLLGLIFLTSFISHRLVRGNVWNSVGIGLGLVFLYGILGIFVVA